MVSSTFVRSFARKPMVARMTRACVLLGAAAARSSHKRHCAESITSHAFLPGEVSPQPLVLAPNALSLFWAGPEPPVWFAGDSRLLLSGTHRLRLVADRGLD